MHWPIYPRDKNEDHSSWSSPPCNPHAYHNQSWPLSPWDSASKQPSISSWPPWGGDSSLSHVSRDTGDSRAGQKALESASPQCIVRHHEETGRERDLERETRVELVLRTVYSLNQLLTDAFEVLVFPLKAKECDMIGLCLVLLLLPFFALWQTFANGLLGVPDGWHISRHRGHGQRRQLKPRKLRTLVKCLEGAYF